MEHTKNDAQRPAGAFDAKTTDMQTEPTVAQTRPAYRPPQRNRRTVSTECNPELIRSREIRVSLDVESDPLTTPSPESEDQPVVGRKNPRRYDGSQPNRTPKGPGTAAGGARNKRNADDVERKRKRMAIMIGVIAAAIFVLAFLMVAIGLRMSAYIDNMLRKENEMQTLTSMSTNGDVHNVTTTVASTMAAAVTDSARLNSTAGPAASTWT